MMNQIKVSKINTLSLRHTNSSARTLKSSFSTRLLTWLHIVSNSVNQAFLSRIKVLILRLLLRLDRVEQLSLLLLRQLFTINTCILSSDFSHSLGILLLLDLALLHRGLLLDFRWFNVVLWLSKVKLNIRLNATNLIIWLALYDVNGIFLPSILNIDCITFVKDRVMCQFMLQTKTTLKLNKTAKMITYIALGSVKSINAVS